MASRIKLDSKKEYKTLIDITPMVDLVFLLVIFFMLTSSMGKLSSINVNLPRAEQSDERNEADVVISIDKDNQLYVDDEKTDIKSLLSKVSPRANTDSGRILIRADKETDYETVVSVIDALNSSGIKNFVLGAVKSK